MTSSHDASEIDAFVAAGENSKIGVLKALLARGVDVDCKDSRFSRTALHAAAVRAEDDMTAYMFALDGQCTPEVFRALLQAGAPPPNSDSRLFVWNKSSSTPRTWLNSHE